MSNSSLSEQNLLFCLLSLQAGLISPEQLSQAVHQWGSNKAAPIGDILETLGHLSGQQRSMVDGLIAVSPENPEAKAINLQAAESAVSIVFESFQELGDSNQNRDANPLAEDQPSPDKCWEPGGTIDEVPKFGRFQKVRLHAEGGLGRVYHARDEDLNRDVALKEMRPERDQPEDRKRFEFEARVTGRLQHPGIVPVYALEFTEDNHPTYAMRFIHGETLTKKAGLVNRQWPLHSPAERTRKLRELLGCLIAVCQAIEYAHSRGVLHRDLKPDNIMCGLFGETLVVDWGLAKILDAPEEAPISGESIFLVDAESGHSSGHIAGTPHYMSPEQAGGGKLSATSDVYSLGAILYFLLTGENAFAPLASTDKTVVRGFLDQIIAGKFLPPTSVLADVPKALESICLKAMANNPADRHASAGELAEDLEEWLAVEAVREYREQIETARQEAEYNAQLALRTLNRVVFETQRKLESLPATHEVRLQLLESAANDLQELANRLLSRSTADRSLMVAMMEIGDILVECGGENAIHKAHQMILQATALAKQLAENDPQNSDPQFDLSIGYNNLGDVLLTMGNLEEALLAYQKGLAIREQGANLDSENLEWQRVLSISQDRVGDVLQMQGEYLKAQAAFEKGLAIRKQMVHQDVENVEWQRNLSVSQIKIGDVLSMQEDPTNALIAYQNALAIREQLCLEDSSNINWQRDLSVNYDRVGDVLCEQQNFTDALEAYQKGLAIAQQLADRDPDHAELQRDLSVSHNKIADVLLAQDHSTDAMTAYAKALSIRKHLAQQDPGNAERQQDLAVCHIKIAEAHESLNDPDKAKQHKRECYHTLQFLVANSMYLGEKLTALLDELADLFEKE